jgi:hypothetical protein
VLKLLFPFAVEELPIAVLPLLLPVALAPSPHAVFPLKPPSSPAGVDPAPN